MWWLAQFGAGQLDARLVPGLLVYDDELPPDLARNELKSKLRGEWRLERRSARHTELVPRKD